MRMIMINDHRIASLGITNVETSLLELDLVCKVYEDDYDKWPQDHLLKITNLETSLVHMLLVHEGIDEDDNEDENNEWPQYSLLRITNLEKSDQWDEFSRQTSPKINVNGKLTKGANYDQHLMITSQMKSLFGDSQSPNPEVGLQFWEKILNILFFPRTPSRFGLAMRGCVTSDAFKTHLYVSSLDRKLTSWFKMCGKSLFSSVERKSMNFIESQQIIVSFTIPSWESPLSSTELLTLYLQVQPVQLQPQDFTMMSGIVITWREKR